MNGSVQSCAWGKDKLVCVSVKSFVFVLCLPLSSFTQCVRCCFYFCQRKVNDNGDNPSGGAEVLKLTVSSIDTIRIHRQEERVAQTQASRGEHLRILNLLHGGCVLVWQY